MNAVAITPRFTSLGAMLAAQAQVMPDKPALICGARQQSYRDFDTATNRLANQLLSRHPDQKIIGILGKNSDVFLEILFGIVKTGGMAMTLNWRLAVPEMRAIVLDSTIGLLFYDREFASVVDALDLPLHCIAYDGTGATPMGYDALVAGGAATLPPVDVPATSPAILMYTSGTTGTPKGVAATHAALLTSIESIGVVGQNCAATAQDIALLTTPLFHLAAFGSSFGALHGGATLVILPSIDMPSITAAIASHRVTRTVVLPALMPALLDTAENGVDLSSLRLIGYGAQPIPVPLLARMLTDLRCGFLQNYGMTEISGSATYLAPDDHYPGSPYLLSCGRPYPHIRLAIAGPDGAPCQPGEIGEIMLQSPTLFQGYWNRPEATAEVMRDGWYATGDMGYLDADGYLYLMDRKKDMIITGGENVFPAEVESALSGHPDVSRVAVIGVPSEKWGEEVKAVVVLKAGAKADPAELIAYLRLRLAGYKLPKTIDLVEELPMTAVGKIAKPQLREKYWAGLPRRIN